MNFYLLMARYPLKYWKFFWVWNHVYVRHQQGNPHIPAVNTLPQACSQVLFREKEKIKRWLYLIRAELWEAFWDSLRYSSCLEMSEQTAVFILQWTDWKAWKSDLLHLKILSCSGRNPELSDAACLAILGTQGTTWVTLQASLLMLLPLELSHSWPVPCITFPLSDHFPRALVVYVSAQRGRCAVMLASEQSDTEALSPA